MTPSNRNQLRPINLRAVWLLSWNSDAHLFSHPRCKGRVVSQCGELLTTGPALRVNKMTIIGGDNGGFYYLKHKCVLSCLVIPSWSVLHRGSLSWTVWTVITCVVGMTAVVIADVFFWRRRGGRIGCHEFGPPWFCLCTDLCVNASYFNLAQNTKIALNWLQEYKGKGNKPETCLQGLKCCFGMQFKQRRKAKNVPTVNASEAESWELDTNRNMLSC